MTLIRGLLSNISPRFAASSSTPFGRYRQARIALLEKVPNLILIGTAHFYGRTVGQNQMEFTIHVGTHFFHTIQVDDGAPMHPLENCRVQLIFQFLHGHSHNMRLFVCMDTHIITRGIHPVDIFSFYQCGFAAIFDRDTVRIGPTTGLTVISWATEVSDFPVILITRSSNRCLSDTASFCVALP